MNKENIVILSGSLPTDKGEISIRTSKRGGAYAVVTLTHWVTRDKKLRIPVLFIDDYATRLLDMKPGSEIVVMGALSSDEKTSSAGHPFLVLSVRCQGWIPAPQWGNYFPNYQYKPKTPAEIADEQASQKFFSF